MALFAVVKVVLAIVYLFAGLALFWGRKRLVAGGSPPNLVIPAVLLVLACITTLFPLW
jgi:hypothetical protein